MAKKTARHDGKLIRQNRPNFRKKLLKHHSGGIKYVHRGKKLKSKEWERVDKKATIIEKRIKGEIENETRKTKN